MRKSAGFAAVAILTTALGVGAGAAVFSVVNGVLLRPLPYPQPERLAILWRLAPVSNAFGAEDYPWGRFDFSLYRDQTKLFQSLGAFEPQTYNLTGPGEPVFLEGMRATAGFFPAMGVAPAIGRYFTPEEDRPGGNHVAVLSDALWRERFGAKPDLVGRSIELNGAAYHVIGVMPPGFSFPHAEEMPSILEFPREAQLWTPLAIAPGERGPSELAVVGRMRPGGTIAQAQAELDVFGRNYERIFPAAKGWSRSRALSLEKQIVGDTGRPLLLLLGAVGVVLLIACSNVAGLLLTRSLARGREFGLRAALGAGHGRLARQMLTENVLLAAVGGALGMALAEAGVWFVKSLGPSSLPRLREVAIDPAVFAFCAGVTLISGLLFGLAPSFGAARANLAECLKTGGRVVGGGLSPRLRSALVIGQIALALTLVSAAGLLIRTFHGLLGADRGFQPDRVLTFEISLPLAKYPDPDSMARLYSRALGALQSLPGVESAGLAHAVPMGGAPDATVIRVPERPPKPNEQPYANYMFASPGFFAAVRTPLVAGRDFVDTDTLDAEHVTIVNRAMAEALWPGQNAVGKHVGLATTRFPPRTVIGVVANVKQSSLREEAAPEMYVPFTQNEVKIWPPMGTMQAAVRTAADPAAMVGSIRQAMRTVDPDLPLAKVATLTQLVRQSMTQARFAMLLLTAFGALALFLAAAGMYGVISHFVSQRTQEIGIRMALGAQRTAVFGMVLRQGAQLASAGIAAGLLGSWAAARAMESFLFRVKPADPLTLGAVAALLAAVALAACYLPARRAARVDPVIALRNE